MLFDAPILLNEQHRLQDFDCGVDSINDWLKRRALANQYNNASRTYVIVVEGKVIAFYCLASGALASHDAPGATRRNMPEPIPVAILGRLGIDTAWQHRGLGAAMLQDAVLRTASAADIIGIKGIIVHAVSASAKNFYMHYGFTPSPTQPMLLILSLKP